MNFVIIYSVLVELNQNGWAELNNKPILYINTAQLLMSSKLALPNIDLLINQAMGRSNMICNISTFEIFSSDK